MNYSFIYNTLFVIILVSFAPNPTSFNSITIYTNTTE